jgi:hypothetical protein
MSTMRSARANLARLAPNSTGDRAGQTCIHGSYARNRNLSVALHCFIDFLVQRLPQDPGWASRSPLPTASG